MICEQFLQIIDDLIEDELDGKTAALAVGHLPGCPKCRAQYEMRQAEKRLYSGFLFNVEPSKNLWAELEEKINRPVKGEQGADQAAAGGGWLTGLAALMRLKTVWALPAVMLIAGMGGIFKLGLLNASDNVELIQNKGSEISKLPNIEPDILRSPNSRGQMPAPVAVEAEPGQRFVRKAFRAVPVKQSRKKTVFENINLTSAKLSGRGIRSPLRKSPAKAEKVDGPVPDRLIAETARQVEKIEMLLRSFRNARMADGADAFDVGYETRQARRLLAKNAELRQKAENRGDLYTEEMLDKAETVLLDIANLEKAPAPDKVAGIRERVRNQNIIAGLQVY